LLVSAIFWYIIGGVVFDIGFYVLTSVRFAINMV
jgi:hypothetical protein